MQDEEENYHLVLILIVFVGKSFWEVLDAESQKSWTKEERNPRLGGDLFRFLSAG